MPDYPTDTREARGQQARQLEDDDLHWLMADARGRRIVWRWLERAGVWRLSFDRDALAMAFNEGARNQGLRLLDTLLTVCPDLYNTLMEEAHDDRHHDRHHD